MEILVRIAESLEKGNPDEVLSLTKEAMAEKISAVTILNEGLIAGMGVVGRKFAAKAMYAGMEELKPLLVEEKAPTRGKVVLGSIQGDLHNIGKNLVGIMLKGAGYDVIDLGHDVSPEDFVDTAVKEGAQLIGMSALLTTTMANMRKTVGLLKERGLDGKVLVIVGGAPLSEDFAESIGADAYAFDAASAVDRVNELIGQQGNRR